jgi:hypothetical protein
VLCRDHHVRGWPHRLGSLGRSRHSGAKQDTEQARGASAACGVDALQLSTISRAARTRFAFCLHASLQYSLLDRCVSIGLVQFSRFPLLELPGA